GGIQDREKYVSDLEEAIQGAHELARANLKTAQERLKRDYDLKVVVKRFKGGGSSVSIGHGHHQGKMSKTDTILEGPWGGGGKSHSISLQGQNENSNGGGHHDRIKLCKDREVPNWCKKLQAQVISRNWKEIEELEPKGKKGKNIYCSCRGPDDGGLMIRCDECREWFHGRCVDITPGEADRMDAYQCPGYGQLSEQAGQVRSVKPSHPPSRGDGGTGSVCVGGGAEAAETLRSRGATGAACRGRWGVRRGV
ncbi:Hypothetical predicted protein, partial [Mytilus galloprovincialis]